ncbi:MAG: hypothetical protein ACI85O_001803 [Saprospiraceae bacterium]|jgi:hypothetical protein
MKNLYIILMLPLCSVGLYAQSPEKMSYQAILRDAADVLIVNQGIGIQVSVLQSSASGTAVYVETHSATTNANGLVSLEIGIGTPTTGTFSGIDWSAGPYFLKRETDPTASGGTNYTITGTTELLSVPFAMHAKTADNGIPSGGTEGQVLTISGGVPVWADPPASALAIGDIHSGGMIFYLESNGLHGLIAALSDQSTSSEWGCYGTDISGLPNVPYNGGNPVGPGTEVGDGASNTTLIVNNCAEAGIAARLCHDLVLGGYNDWFLPSAGELNLMYVNLHLNALGGFGSSYYWSSTEFDNYDAWYQYFSNGDQFYNFKDSNKYVRAVRAF